jgi:small subunit ribosomal protein S21
LHGRGALFVPELARFASNLGQLNPINGPPLDQTSNVSSMIGDAPWQVWRWDSLAEVRVQEGEPLENALRRFKRKVQQEDIIKEVKRHSYYLKPGEKKRVKAALARKRNRKKARKEQD